MKWSDNSSDIIADLESFIKTTLSKSDRRKKIVTKGGAIMAAKIKRLAPLGPTGNLKKSIVAKPFQAAGPSDAFVAIDRKIAPHAHLIEYGTVKMPAKPFFRRGIEQSKGKAFAYIEKELLKGGF